VFSSEAKRLVKADLENICLENVQACILVGNICFAESNADLESLYFGKFEPSELDESSTNFVSVIANRMAQLLKLADENPADDYVLREVKRRVWWSLYMVCALRVPYPSIDCFWELRDMTYLPKHAYAH
jgi:hypothetical protein